MQAIQEIEQAFMGAPEAARSGLLCSLRQCMISEDIIRENM